MPLKLPPLNTLRLFEAAGRHLSFKNAADELRVTPSAVSHGIQTLEDWVGTPLFNRGPRGLSLTPAADAFLPQVRDALTLLANASERIPGRRATGALAISVAPTFASRWLLPRLPGFFARHPDVMLTLDTSPHYVEFPLDGLDLAIRMARPERAGAGWQHLVGERLVPVCSASLSQSLGAAAWPGILTQAPLIHVSTATEDWDVWLGAQGLSSPEAARGLIVNTIQMAIEAAVQGLGVALGRRPLIDEFMAGNQLVAVGPETAGSASYWLVGLEGDFERPEITQFRRWLIEELGRQPE